MVKALSDSPETAKGNLKTSSFNTKAFVMSFNHKDHIYGPVSVLHSPPPALWMPAAPPEILWGKKTMHLFHSIQSLYTTLCWSILQNYK